MADPSTDTWHETMGLSTSAQLRHTQTALSASQADLTHVERQLREAEAERLVAEARLHDALNDCDALRLLWDEAANEARVMRKAAEQYLEALAKTEADLATARYQNRRLTAENEAALRRLNEQRDWQVADRDTGITCSSCAEPIVRGQAFQPLADAKGYFAHCACPDKES